MLKEFLHQLEEPKEVDSFKERVKLMIQLFDSLVDYLRDAETFPNQEINQLATLMWRLIGNKHIPVALDPTGGMPSISFAVLGRGSERTPILFLPQNFIELTAEALELQIGAFAYMASQCRDYFCNKIIGTNSRIINLRAQAYEAEALITLVDLAEQEEVELRLLEFQRQILEQFPQGLEDLSQELRYATPRYKEIHSLFKQDPRSN